MSFEGSIAIVGAAGRFPNAGNVREFWTNLREGRECLSVFSRQDMTDVGVHPKMMDHPDYVPIRGALGSVDQFDADFFGFTPREAEFTDPQQRLFMECAWEALESAGCDPDTFDGPIGLFGGSSLSNYFFLLSSVPEIVAQAGHFQLEIGSDKDFLCTRTSYKLNLSGPSVNVNTACSTSLVAVTLACQSLLTHQCDMALAGGVSIHIPESTGYLFTKGGILSPDGHCRAFDAQAEGTVGGNGVGLVVLKRLEEAIESGDNIIAAIKGFALNNDGGRRVGFTAPSIEGQSNVIAEALAVAGVEADTISYVEAHGTGTSLGDPIEVEALTRAFRSATEKKQFCAIGSVKTNVGHLDAAAGIAGLIKAALAVRDGVIPPSLHYQRPNPRIDFENSPFYVNTRLQAWPGAGPRRAGVSSFGIGGTNAHVVLEQAPARPASSSSRPLQIFPLSARTPEALRRAAQNLAQHLETQPTASLPDAAYTLAVGRKAFGHRMAIVAADAAEAVRKLRGPAVLRGEWKGGARGVAMLLTGQGSQYVGMGRELYESEAVFRREIDRCCGVVNALLGIDLWRVMQEGEGELLRQTWVTQPALYVLERALLRLWESWGVRPEAMLGHSLGEVVAATEAGVWTEEEGLRLVALRGRLMWATEPGAMISVLLGEEEEAGRYQSGQVSLAAINGKRQAVYSGSVGAIEELERTFVTEGKPVRRLEVERAFHSGQMEAVREEYVGELGRIRFRTPKLRFVSNVSGEWAGEEVCEPGYWWRQLREPVRFAAGVRLVAKERDWAWLEVGPGEALSRLVRSEIPGAAVASGLTAGQTAGQTAAHAAVKLWVSGVKIDWPAYYAGEKRYRTDLPTYPFERNRYWPWIPNYAPDSAIKVTPGSTPVATHYARPQLDTAFVPPSSETELAIAIVWRNLLGLDKVGAADDFFELGGSSLLAIQMAQQLRKSLNTEIPLERFLQDATVAGLARAIVTPQADNSAPACLAPMRTTGSKPPFFAVHPIGGGCFIFRHLVERLGPDQPFYGLQAAGLADLGQSGDPFSSLEEMAAFYVDAIRTVQARGPYHLGGLSWGGVAAFEMARQLKTAGQEINLLALLDTPSPAQLIRLDRLTDAATLVGLARDLGFQRGVDLALTVERVEALSDDKKAECVLRELQRHGILSAEATSDWLKRHLAGYRSRLRFLRHYHPSVYDGRLTFFRAGDLDEIMRPQLDRIELDYHDPVFAWDSLSSEPVQVHTVPGNHSEIVFEPNVRVLAELLTPLITKPGNPVQIQSGQLVSDSLLSPSN